MKLVECLVRRGPMESIPKVVPEYEARIVSAIHGEDAVSLGAAVTVDRQAPDAAEEYDRLSRAYGAHPDLGVPWVEYVFGRQEAGRFEDAVAQRALKAQGRS